MDKFHFYTPTEEQKKQVEAAIEQANLTVGRFVLEWSRIEGFLRTLELMRTDAKKYEFRPVPDLYAIDLKKTRKFRQRVGLVIPKNLGPGGFPIHDWLIETSKVRNQLLHGTMIFRSRKDDKDSEAERIPTIVHSDFVSTMMASEGFPNVVEIHIPAFKNSLRADSVILITELDALIDQAKSVGETLQQLIVDAHSRGAACIVSDERA